MKIEKVDIKQLISPDYNPRDITPEEMEKLKTSIQEFGYIDPIIVNDVNNHIVGGNQRYEALKELEYTEVDVVYVHEEDLNREKALNIALNKISGDWDNEKLTQIFTDFKLTGFENTELTGFDDAELTFLPDETEYGFKEEQEDIKEYEPPKEVFKLLITFENEKTQQEYYEKFTEEGLECRILTL